MFIPKLVEVMAKMEMRTGRRLTQQEIAEATGISANTIGRWMRREPMANIKPETVEPLLDFFDCTLNDLVEIRRVEMPG